MDVVGTSRIGWDITIFVTCTWLKIFLAFKLEFIKNKYNKNFKKINIKIYKGDRYNT